MAPNTTLCKCPDCHGGTFVSAKTLERHASKWAGQLAQEATHEMPSWGVAYDAPETPPETIAGEFLSYNIS